jgi:hypothetical protein
MTIRDLSSSGWQRLARFVVVAMACLALAVSGAVALAADPSASPNASGSPETNASPEASPSPTPDSSTAPDKSGIAGRIGRHGGLPFGKGGFGRAFNITIEAINGTSLALETDNGWTRTIDVAGVTISKGGETIGVDGLTVGDRIAIRESRDDDGSFTINGIVVILPRVVGQITEVGDSSFTVRRPDGTTTTVAVNDSTTYTALKEAGSKEDLAVGAKVDVEGTESGNTFTASAVHIFPATVGGVVTAKTADSITVRRFDGTVATIHVDSSTEYHAADGSASSLAEVAVDARIGAHGTANDDGSLDATDVYLGGARGIGRGHGMGPGKRFDRGFRLPGMTPGAEPAPTPTPSADGSGTS